MRNKCSRFDLYVFSHTVLIILIYFLALCVNCSIAAISTGSPDASAVCIKPKPPHAGIRFLSTKSGKSSKHPRPTILPTDLIIFHCLTTDHKTSIKCLESGRWAEMPDCPNPDNMSCPELDLPQYPLNYNATGPPFKIGQVVAFTCDTTNSTSTTTAKSIRNYNSTISSYSTSFFNSTINFNSTSMEPTNDFFQTAQVPVMSYPTTEPAPIVYNLNGSRTIKCLMTARWSNPPPVCVPVKPVELPSRLNYLVATTFLVLLPFILILTIIIYKGHKRQQAHARWKQYFTDYAVRTSRTRINIGTCSSLTAESPHYEQVHQYAEAPKMREEMPVTDL